MQAGGNGPNCAWLSLLRPHAREGLEQQDQRWKIKEAITFRHEVGAGARAEKKEKKRWVCEIFRRLEKVAIGWSGEEEKLCPGLWDNMDG